MFHKRVLDQIAKASPTRKVANPHRNNETDSTLTNADKIHLLSTLQKGSVNRVFFFKLNARKLEMPPNMFRTTAHWILNLPQPSTSTNRVHNEATDLYLDECNNINLDGKGRGCDCVQGTTKRPVLDPALQHHTNCNAKHVRYRMHNIVAHTVAGAARNANAWEEIASEPNTNRLLGVQGLPPVFPLNASGQEKQFREAIKLTIKLKEATRIGHHDEILKAAKAVRIAANALNHNTQRRADLHLRNAHNEAVVDFCLCSAVCKSNERTSLNHLTILQQNNLILAKGGRVPQKNAHITQNAPTHTVRTAVQKKNKTYIYFMDVLNSGRHEDNHAKFYPAVLSHSGEFSEGLSELLELNYVEFKRALSKAPERRDSRTTRVQAREAKTLTKDHVIHALARGINDMIQIAGHPHYGGRLQRRGRR